MMVNSGLSGGLYYIYMVGGAITILKNMSSSMGRMTSHIWKIKFRFQTTRFGNSLILKSQCFIGTSSINHL